MSKSIKLKNNNYWDSSSIVHNRTKLSDILNAQKKEIYLNPNSSTDIEIGATTHEPLLISITGSGSFFETSVLIHLYRINLYAMYYNQLSKYIYDNHDWLNIEFENSEYYAHIKLTNTSSSTSIGIKINIIPLYIK